VRDYGSLKTVRNNAVIVYYCDRPKVSETFLKYLNRFKLENKDFFLLHLSQDTTNSHDTLYYSLAQHVFYTNPYQNAVNATWVPLGFRTGFMNYTTVTPSNFRKYSIVYIGNKIIDKLRMIPNSKQFIIPHPRYSFPIHIKQMYCDSNYTYLLYLNTSTLFEALEWGSIPIIENKLIDFNCDFTSPIFTAFHILYTNICTEINDHVDYASLNRCYIQLKQIIGSTVYSEMIKHSVVI
jgi:hypothetical protein